MLVFNNKFINGMNFFFSILSLLFTITVSAQLDAGSVMGIPRAADLASLNTITGPNPQVGSMAYNETDNKIYIYVNDIDRWVAADSDAQNASEVPLVTNVDVDEGAATSPVLETNVEEVIQAIAPITSKAGRVFYPPSIQIDASVDGTFTVNLYDQYVAQHTGTGIVRSIDGMGEVAPNIPIYAANELYYYVTFADPSVFGTISINGDTGLMTYQIIGRPVDFNSLINVVFVVK